MTLAQGSRAAFFAVPMCILVGGNVGLILGVVFNFVVVGSSGGPQVSVANFAVVAALLGLLLSPLASLKLVQVERRWAGKDESRGAGTR